MKAGSDSVKEEKERIKFLLIYSLRLQKKNNFALSMHKPELNHLELCLAKLSVHVKPVSQIR
jgi:hypothetical protein